MIRRDLYIYLIINIYTTLPGVTTGGDNVCHQETACLCRFNDGRSLNLDNMILGKNFISASRGNLTFYYHGCVDDDFSLEIENIGGDGCREKLSLCLYNKTDGSLTTLGLARQSKFEQDNQHPKITEILYNENDTKTAVTLICTPSFPETSLMVHSLGKAQYNLRIFSPQVCEVLDSIGLSTGSKLLVMLLVFSSLYFIGGSCISYFIRGARGKEVIPNIDFWTNLPGLVKDGIIFIMNGCNARMVPTSDSYDQI